MSPHLFVLYCALFSTVAEAQCEAEEQKCSIIDCIYSLQRKLKLYTNVVPDAN